MLLKCYSQYTSKFGKPQWPQISFHSNSKEGQCQRKFKLRHNYTHFTCQQGNVQNPLSRPQIYMNQELLNVQAGFRKGKDLTEAEEIKKSWQKYIELFKKKF